ncbi:MAG: hypothetical protein HFI09_01215 [Bacilli bacterium]|nr:hypothetical protein [Bacilli bacterium]
MVERNIEQIYEIFYTMLYTKKISLEQYRDKNNQWSNQEKRFEHLLLDEMQMLLESFHEKSPMLMSYTEVISDFRLMEQIFPTKIPLGSVPMECGYVFQDGVLKLSVKERIRFLNWYLKQHHKFFKDSRNIDYYHQLAFYLLERDRMFGFSSKIDFYDQKELYFYYDQLFFEKQRDSLQLMQYFGRPSEEGRKSADQILKKWHMSKHYRDGLLAPYLDKKMPMQQKVSVCSKTESINSFEQKMRLSRLHELWNGKTLVRYLTQEEVLELHDLFTYCYGIELGNNLFRTVILQNNVLFEEKKEMIRKSCLDIQEEELYQEMINTVFDSTCMIPYYFGIMKSAQTEIQDILSEAVLEEDLESYETYRIMLYDEFLKMKEAYISLYISQKKRFKELD